MLSKPTCCKCCDASDANIPSALFNVLAAVSAVCALVSDEWIRIDKHREGSNENQVSSNSSFDSNSYNAVVSFFVRADRCKRIGIRHFWHSAKFGSFVDMKGVYHTTYHFNGRVLIDCITPLLANLFHMLIAFCFVIVVKSIFACILSIISTPGGFLSWLKRNSILEMSSMVLSVLACLITLIAGALVYSKDPYSNVTVGTGSIFTAVSGVSSFSAVVASLRRSYQTARQRRLENQRLFCARSLRSWRENSHHLEDTQPVIDFERYLDSWAAPNDLESLPQ